MTAIIKRLVTLQTNFQKSFSLLSLFEDSVKTMRLKGRLGDSLLEYQQEYPIILYGYQSLFTKSLIVNAYQKILYTKELNLR